MRVLLLLSGGFDSPVAARLLQRDGHEVEALHFSLEPFTDGRPTEKCIRLAGLLGLRRLRVVDAGELFADIAREGKRRYYFVLSKVFMLKTAEALARREGFDALATGESLGQVSSQTLPHLSFLAAQTTLPVVRPLLGFDKSEIVDLARRIGTFETSAGPEVCDVLGPKHPLVEGRPELLAQELSAVGMDSLVERALARVREASLPPETARPSNTPSA